MNMSCQINKNVAEIGGKGAKIETEFHYRRHSVLRTHEIAVP